MVDLTKHPSLDTGASVRVADLLLERGLRVDEPAFVLEDWHATPLWHAISRGHNLVLAAHLLQRECDPDHCLWAAAYGDDVDAIRLLLEHGAELDPVYHTDGNTPLHVLLDAQAPLERIRAVLEQGAKGDLADDRGRTVEQILRKKRNKAIAALANEFFPK